MRHEIKPTAAWTIVAVAMCVLIAAASQRKPGHSAISASIVAMLHGKVEVITAQEVPKKLEEGSTAHLQEIT